MLNNDAIKGNVNIISYIFRVVGRVYRSVVAQTLHLQKSDWTAHFSTASPHFSVADSPHVCPHSFPRRPRLCVRHYHVVHFPYFMQFIDYCLWANSWQIDDEYEDASALRWVCPIPLLFPRGILASPFGFPSTSRCHHFLLFCPSWPW